MAGAIDVILFLSKFMFDLFSHVCEYVRRPYAHFSQTTPSCRDRAYYAGTDLDTVKLHVILPAHYGGDTMILIVCTLGKVRL